MISSRDAFIETEDFTPVEVKAIALSAVKLYKKLSLIQHIKNPENTLKTALSQPTIVLKFIEFAVCISSF